MAFAVAAADVAPEICRSVARFSSVSTAASASSFAAESRSSWADIQDDDESPVSLPTLLGRRQHFEVAIKVKNTFIECFAVDEDEDEELGELPAFRRSQSWAHSARGDRGLTPPCEGEAAPQPQPQASAEPTDPLEVRRPSWSSGSAEHEAGTCRPCSWFWTPQGCDNGAECRHCHLCPVGEVKKKRKANRRLARALEQKTKNASSSAEGSADE